MHSRPQGIERGEREPGSIAPFFRGLPEAPVFYFCPFWFSGEVIHISACRAPTGQRRAHQCLLPRSTP